MGKGIDLAAIDAPEHAAAMEDMKDQLLLVFLERLGGKATVPVSEVDATGRFNLSMRLDVERRLFVFELERKQ